MEQGWTFGKKLGFGFSITVFLTVAISAVAIYALRQVVEDKDQVITIQAQSAILAERMQADVEHKVSASRAFLLTKEESSLDTARSARSDFLTRLAELRDRIATAESRKLVDDVEKREAAHQSALDRVIAQRRSEPSTDVVARAFETDVHPKMLDLRQSIKTFVDRELRLLSEGQKAASDSASYATSIVIVMSVAAVLLAVVVAFLLTRTLTRQVGSAVQHIQSSSTELQTAANQQVTGTKEQATAMNEISTTITELLATSKQIAESAQRVAHIAEETASGARVGDQTVQKAQQLIGEMRKQVDAIVNHMLDLGRKSQQVGGILEIINELAEQTNILAINATIEAAGAGESGKRFAVVADEIRKLADRVAASTKEIRGLIEETRSAVNTTVMVTEGGSKAVEAGTRQFSEVATAFSNIAGLVGTTTEAAREIELSTKQQATAVEQVKVAISNVTQASKEAEASSSQTLQTASELAALSKELTRLIQPNV
jgi:methyl-accepting chemotaxis protein